MEFMGIMILTTIGGFILYAIQSALVRAPGQSLNQKFVALGTLSGKTYSEIVAKVGAPSATSAMAGGKTLRQWQATGYHIALIFDKDDICEGITSEISV